MVITALPLIAGLWPAADPSTRLDHLIVGYACMGLPYLWLVLRWRTLPDDRRGFWTMVGAALVARLLLVLLLPPLLSEDIWRYVWDGLVQHAGVDPYAFAPNDPALDFVAQSDTVQWIRSQIGHAHIPTIYPPAAQGLFFVTSGLSTSAGPLRVALAVADAGTCAALWHWAQATDRRPVVAWLYALSPMALMESSVGSHVDAIGVLGMVGAAACLAHSQPVRAGVGWAIGIGTKLLPIMAAPALLRRAPVALTAGGVALFGMYAVYYSPDLFGGLQTYGHRWRANDGAFAVFVETFAYVWPDTGQPVDLPAWMGAIIRRLVGPNGHSPPALIWPDEAAFGAAKATALCLLGSTWAIAVLRGRSYAGLLFAGVGALLLVSPVVHPWYLMWILPLACMATARRSPWAWPFIGWSLLVWIAYLPRPHYLVSGVWAESTAWRWLEYAPVWIAISLAAVQASILRRPS